MPKSTVWTTSWSPFSAAGWIVPCRWPPIRRRIICPVLNEEREQQVLDGVRRAAARYDERGAGFPGAAAVVFSTMMDTSRALQHPETVPPAKPCAPPSGRPPAVR